MTKSIDLEHLGRPPHSFEYVLEVDSIPEPRRDQRIVDVADAPFALGGELPLLIAIGWPFDHVDKRRPCIDQLGTVGRGQRTDLCHMLEIAVENDFDLRVVRRE